VKNTIALLIAASLLSCGIAHAADPAPGTSPGTETGQPTSNRTPGKETPTPVEQGTRVEGQTSDRTPSEEAKTDNDSQSKADKRAPKSGER
jgi:hypothetical protein